MRRNLLAISIFRLTAGAQAGICTREYAPVCGQLPQHTQTFSNRCMLKDAGAVWLSDGECPSSRVNAKAKNITLTVAGHDAAWLVRATPIENPPLDSSDTRYELVRVVSRHAAQ